MRGIHVLPIYSYSVDKLQIQEIIQSLRSKKTFQLSCVDIYIEAEMYACAVAHCKGPFGTYYW